MKDAPRSKERGIGDRSEHLTSCYIHMTIINQRMKELILALVEECSQVASTKLTLKSRSKKRD